MLPEIEILGRVLPSYGVLGVLGVLLGLLIAVLRCPRFGLSRDDGAYIYVFGAIGAMLGAKLLYMLLSLGGIAEDISLLITDPVLFAEKYILGGMVFYGGAIGAATAAYLTARAYKRRLSDFFPVLLPGMALAHGIARIGCFLTGCCYGVESHGPLAVTFSQSPVAPNGVSLVPVQLLESAGVLLICAFLIRYSGRAAKREHLAYAYIFLYAPLRFVLEIYRGDAVRGSLLGLSTSQWISLALVAAALCFSAFSARMTRRAESA